MHKFFFLLLLGFGLSLTLPVAAQPRPRFKAKRAFAHNSESGRGRSNKAHFRKENVRPIIDLKPHKLESFRTTKAPKSYKYRNPR